MTGHELRLELARGSARCALPVEGTLTLGSHLDCDLHIAHATVSRHHARLHLLPTGPELEDLGSRNGTFVDGRQLKPGERVGIAVGVPLRLGSVAATYVVLAAGDDSIAVPMDSSECLEPDGNDGRTLSGGGSEALWVRVLPGLLARIRQGQTRYQIARSLGEALRIHWPLAALRVERNDLGADNDPMAAAVVAFEDPGATTARIATFDANEFRFVCTLTAVDDARLLLGLAPMCSALIDLGKEPAPTPRSPIQAEPPQPESLDASVRAIFARARRVATSHLNVLIRGESGTGKEILASFIHRAAGMADHRLVAVNCAALPDDLLEVELFGIEKGVATGVDSRIGLFERADQGTLFLDEIGDMSLAMQAKILRVLERREVTRVGGQRAHPARVRVISATHQPLEDMVESGGFRRDLWHRIADWEVRLPALRERPADIPGLASHFLAAAAAHRGLRLRGITRRALAALCQYPWPGNVRELEREMQRAVVFLDQDAALSSEDLRPEIRDSGGGEVAMSGSLELQLAYAERKVIERSLAKNDGDVTKTAALLQVSRATLYRRMALWPTTGEGDSQA
ncbi:MAG: sigma 54-interacting transcriptional regulator [Rhodanobacteraceae bacterium]|nr:sigma 54-interacting transcriptional regulator [Rhodanobacteraceae bacterium]MBK7042846.1 sigma 54-interacting transcriptional regulator [Rhodanobacteraceae bacterium]MBP9154652.1 sigma 54-interacting transcriptional regulator [Xanthomonadales bacterium]HQW80257.1 sigma 54-interacting transcriptional regulator [Pseudomonadota bacterium]